MIKCKKRFNLNFPSTSPLSPHPPSSLCYPVTEIGAWIIRSIYMRKQYCTSIDGTCIIPLNENANGYIVAYKGNDSAFIPMILHHPLNDPNPMARL
jgi:hypothetical protein